VFTVGLTRNCVAIVDGSSVNQNARLPEFMIGVLAARFGPREISTHSHRLAELGGILPWNFEELDD
jgi:hypothetical protein